jgi:hypothetical protein
LYLAASAVVFALGKIGVYQVLFAKRTARGEARRRRCRGVARRGTPTTGRDVPTRGASFVLDPSKPCELRDAVRQTPFDENGEAIARRARLSLSRRHADASTRWPLGRSRSIVSGRMKRMSFSIASRTALRNARADHAVGPRQDFSAAC